MRKKVKSRKRRTMALSIFLVILGVLLIIVGIYGVLWAVHSKLPTSPYGDYLFNNGECPFNLDLFPSLVIDENQEELKVMQIADPQIKFGAFPNSDRKTMALLEKAIKTQQPDLCVVTGDLTLSVFTYDAFKYFADFMQRMNVKWAFVYGNHDAQFDCSKYTICNLLKSYDNCLFTRGPSDVYGESNYLVNVFRGSKSAENLAYSLVMLDSGMYPNAENVKLTDWVYDWIHQSQIDWYSWAVKGLKSINPNVQTSMFFHIPLKEFADMYYLNELQLGRTIPEAVKLSLPDVEIKEVRGSVCETEKSPTECVYGDDGYTVGIYYQGNAEGVTDHPDVFQYVKELGCTKAIFCGHDHTNTLKGYYDGVYLGYGLCCGYHTYPYFNKEWFGTKWFKLSDKAQYNGSLWKDENGKTLEKGVTMIQISLQQENYGALTVTDIGSSNLK